MIVFRPTFEARSVEVGAYLHALGVPYLGCYRTLHGKVRYRFDNPNDDAWQKSLEYRDGTNAMIHAPTYAASYRKLMYEAREARVPTGDPYDYQPAA